MIVVKGLCTKEAPSECEAVEPAPFGAVHRLAADALGRVRHHRAVDVRNREQPQIVESRRSMVAGANRRSSNEARHNARCRRAAPSASSPTSSGHWKNERSACSRTSAPRRRLVEIVDRTLRGDGGDRMDFDVAAMRRHQRAAATTTTCVHAVCRVQVTGATGGRRRRRVTPGGVARAHGRGECTAVPAGVSYSSAGPARSPGEARRGAHADGDRWGSNLPLIYDCSYNMTCDAA